jgi:hypothetical protein
MFYPTSEYAYADENGQNVDPSRFVQHVYADNNEQPASHMIFDASAQDQTQQQTQYRPIVVDGSQPL